jgi:colanic acid/amylovoran biosynthesis glycosyltransferase
VCGLKIAICAYDSADGVGGPFVWVQRMSRELATRGFNVRVLLFHWKPIECGVLHSRLSEQGTPVSCIQFRDSESNVLSILENLRSDLPHVFVADNVIPGLLSGRHLRTWGIPTVGIIRSDDRFYHAVISRFVAGQSRDRVSTAVCVSKYLTETANAAGPRLVPAKHIPSGTPIPPQKAVPPVDALRLIYVGRIVQEQKRIFETTRALIRAVTENSGCTAELVGDGPDRKSVEQLLKSTTSCVRLTGRVDSEECQQRLLNSHILVLLSDYEGTPTAVMEAMACGVVPVCMRMRSGIPELVEHDVTGLIVNDREDDFQQAIRRLRNERGLWERLSNAARQRAEAQFSFHRSADSWQVLLTSLAPMILPSKLSLPRRLSLAPRHPDFGPEDVRLPGFWDRSGKKIEWLIRRTCAFGSRFGRWLGLS